MKKVFLSLATIAFVAAGSLTVTSCGGDDSTGGTTPPPPTELTENFVKYDGEQHQMDGGEYTIDVVGENIAVYSAQEGDAKYAYYTTYFWSGDIENATSIADLNAYGLVGYYVQLQNVQLDAEGEVIDFDLPLPNEAEELMIDSAGAAFNGEVISGLTDVAFNVNTFTATQGAGTSDFNGTFTFGTPLTFDYNGAITFSGSDVSAAKGVASFKQELKGQIKRTENSNLVKSVSKVKVTEFVK